MTEGVSLYFLTLLLLYDFHKEIHALIIYNSGGPLSVSKYVVEWLPATIQLTKLTPVWHSIIPMLHEFAPGAFLIDLIYHLAGYNTKESRRQIDRQWNSFAEHNI